MKKRNLVFNLIMVLCLCMALAVPAFAAENNENNCTEDNELADFPTLDEQEGIIDLLEVLASVNRQNLNTYGTPELSIGQAIKSYDYQNGIFVPTVSIYPIFKNNELFVLAVNGEEDTKNFFSYDKTLIEPLKENIDTEKKFALIFDKYNCYLFDGENWTLLQTYTYKAKDNSILDIDSSFDTSKIELSSFTNKISIGTLYAQSRTVYYTCPIEYVPQVYNNICWAACSASIINTLLNDNLSAVEVAQQYFYVIKDLKSIPNFDTDVSISQMPKILNYYGVYNYEYTYNYVPTAEEIYNNIINGYPVCLSFHDDDNNHACVAYGIDANYNNILVMDPESTIFDENDPNKARVVLKDSQGFYLPFGGKYRLYLYRGCARFLN